MSSRNRRSREPPASYLDGVPMRLSEAFRRPPRAVLPLNLQIPDVYRIIKNATYDFSLEESVIKSAEEQRRVREEEENRKKEQEVARLKKQAASNPTPSVAATTTATSDPQNNANNNATSLRPSAIKIPPKTDAQKSGRNPTSLPSPLLREVSTEKILKPKTVETARTVIGPTPVIASNSFAPVKLSSVPAGGSFNVADWEHIEDPFEIMERRTINDLEELASVLESVSSTNVALAESDLSSVVEEQETEGVVVGVVADQAKPEVDEVAPDRSDQRGDVESSPRALRELAATAGDPAPRIASEGAQICRASPGDEDDASIDEGLENDERPPSYDEVVESDQGAHGGSSTTATASAAVTTETVSLSLQKLEVGSPAPRSNRRSEMSSPSTSTSSGAQSLTQSQLESPRDSCETQVKTMESTSTPLPVASYPEYFPLPDFPSLSEADLPSHRRDSESMNDNSNEVFVAGAVAAAPARSDDSGTTEEQQKNPYNDLSTTLKTLVDKLVDMGFDVGVTSRAVQRFGLDEKQVIDYLCLVSSLTDDGFSPTDAEEALLLNDGEEKRARKFIKALLQFRQFGFDDAKIKAALVASGNDTEKALDQLMVT